MEMAKLLFPLFFLFIKMKTLFNLIFEFSEYAKNKNNE